MIILWLRWGFGLLFLLSSSWVIIFHFLLAWNWYTKKQHSSMVGLYGGVLGVLALVTLPFPGLSKWWWVPLLLDLGSAPLLLSTLFFHLGRIITKKHEPDQK